MVGVIGNMRPRLRRWVAQHPALYLPIRRRTNPGNVLEADTDLVIEGFPRCANTWTEALIRTAGPDLKLAHHSHASAHVIAATRRGIPALVLYRDPDAAVRSLLAMYGARVSAAEAFADYAAFYSAVLRLDSAHILLVPFAQATEAPESVITNLVQRFDLALRVDLVERDAVLRVMEAKERPLAEARRHSGKGPANAAICAPGNADRVSEAAKGEAKVRLTTPDTQTPRLKAHAVYRQLDRAAAQ
jgi:hypothetical protein